MRMSILAIMLSAGLFGMLFILDRTKEQWDRAGVLHDPRPLIVSRLRHHLGYGGVVHNFLNSILRPDAERQEDTAIDLGAVRGTLLYYDSLDVSPMERSSRIIIAEELDRIYVAARRIESGEFKGRAPEDVFRSLDVDLDAAEASIAALPGRILPLRDALRAKGGAFISAQFTLVPRPDGEPLIASHLKTLRPFLGKGDFAPGQFGHALVDELASQ